MGLSRAYPSCTSCLSQSTVWERNLSSGSLSAPRSGQAIIPCTSCLSQSTVWGPVWLSLGAPVWAYTIISGDPVRVLILGCHRFRHPFGGLSGSLSVAPSGHTPSTRATRPGSPSLNSTLSGKWRRLCRPFIPIGYVSPWHCLLVNSSGSQAIPSHFTPSQALECPAVGARHFNVPQWGHGISMPHSGGVVLQCPTVGACHFTAPQWGRGT